MTINDKRPKPICECGDPDCLKGSQTFTPDKDDERFETAEAAIDAAMCGQAGRQEDAQ